MAVIGHYRGKGYVTCFLDTRYLTNWRAELVYSPAIIARLKKERYWEFFRCDGSADTKARVEHLVEWLRKYSDEHHAERLAKRQASQNPQSPSAHTDAADNENKPGD